MNDKELMISYDLPALARQAGMRIQEVSPRYVRFHADLASMESFTFDVSERRLDHCLKMLRQAGYDDAADYLQGVG